MLGFLLAPLVLSSNVLDLTPSNFDQVISKSHVLVEFYAPWCGHCKNLAPTYELLGDAYSHLDDVVIAKVDADEHKDLGSKFGVTGFPTIKFFEKGSKTPEDYLGKRELDDMLEFVAKKTGKKGKNVKPISYVEVLTSSTFDKILVGDKVTLVEFYAPWCGHCKSLAPIYEKVAKVFQNENDCVVANLDATEAEDVAARYDVKGYPTLKFFKDGKVVEEYGGDRDLKGFVTALNKHCGTKRGIDGKLNSEAGKIEKLDALVKDFLKGDHQKSIDSAKKLVKTEKSPLAAYYVKAMEKTVKNKGYAEKEVKRLTKILEGGKTTAQKQDEMVIKTNILREFLGSDDGHDEEL